MNIVRALVYRPQRVWLRRALFQVHLWTGILAGLYIVVVCVSGATLVFRIEIQRTIDPALFTPTASAPVADAATIMERVAAAYPDGTVSGIDAPTTVRPTYLAYVARRGRFLTVLIDPASARVLGELPDRSFIRTLQNLHFDLLAGRAGRAVNGAGALLLLAMALTGIVIWWPGTDSWRRALTIDFRRSGRRLIFDLHSAIGIWSCLAIVLWSITGVAFAFPAPFRSVVNRLSPITTAKAPLSDVAAASGNAPTSRALIERARRQMPQASVARIVAPASANAPFLVMFAASSPTPPSDALTAVYLDRYTGAVLHTAAGTRSAGDVVMAWLAPLHVGNFGGTAVKLLWLALGLAPPTLFVSGFIMWWTRVVRPRRSRRVGRN